MFIVPLLRGRQRPLAQHLSSKSLMPSQAQFNENKIESLRVGNAV